MLSHRGIYIRHNGEKIPYLMASDGIHSFEIVYDDPYTSEKQILRIPVRYNKEFVWKLNKKTISCISLPRMFDVFNGDYEAKEYNAYANATFKHFTEIW